MNIHLAASSPLTQAARPSMGRPVVKICGIREPEHALFAAAEGADMIGLVFARSRRQVSTETAVRVARALGALQEKPILVGVFVNEPLERVLAIAEEVGLGAVQLSGDESPAFVAECTRHYPVIKAVRFPPGTATGEALETLEAYGQSVTGGSVGDPAPKVDPVVRDVGAVREPPLRFLVDAYRPGEYGGTGRVADWSLAAELASRYDIVLAGGLDPSNVAGAIAAVSPWGVDVSSGVESGGVKDPRLIREFLAAARPSDFGF